ncbi:MAG: hypothetical protein H6726_26780 [Sandaracinaceae bacterium]|nr:hypothetical protein [Myxococcales bacterium]MCB9661283.1 hypothetical protein [Sandaracinaceae bacterium]
MTPTAPERARRYVPEELGQLDLAWVDPRVAWATSATASSEWSSSYAAAAACGPPCVFPRHGDHEGTWLPDSSDQRPHIDVTLPEATLAHAVVVCETCGTGSVRRIRDLDRETVLFDDQAPRPKDRRKAQLLVVPLAPSTPAPRRLRVELRGRKEDYEEIDAIGLLLAPLSELMNTRPAPSEARHARYAPDEHGVDDLRGDWRLSWAKAGRASSEYSSDYAARHALGKPRVFPKGGDHAKTWLSDNDDRYAWLEVSFHDEGPCHGFIALETCGAGAVVRATDPSGAELWQGAVDEAPRREARLLCVEFTTPRELTDLRLYVSPAISDYREIDAVALLRCPFEELRRPAPPRPPPPPKPVPGEPRGGFTRLGGTLRGPTPEAPLLHLTLAHAGGTLNVNHGGPATLRLADGHELSLELERTVIYGAPLQRHTAPFGELVASLPPLRDALGSLALPDDTVATLVGTQLVGGEHVLVAGTPVVADAGFREAAGRLEGIRVAALSTRPWDQTTFAARGIHDFERDVRATGGAAEARTEGAFERWRRIANRSASLAAVLLCAASWYAARTTILQGWAATLLTATLLATVTSAVFALELHGRARLVTVVEDGGRRRRGRIRGTPPGWTAFGTGFLLCFALLVGGIAVGTAAARVGELVLRVVFAIGGAHALVRLVMWRWADRGALRATLPLLLGRPAALVEGSRGLLAGALGERHRTTEALSAHSEHLGSYESTDEQGRVTVHEQYRNWNESHLSCDAGQGTRIFLADGTLVVAGNVRRVVDAGVSPRKPKRDEDYARFESQHQEGDPAVLLGRLVRRDEHWEVDDAVLLLGSRSQLWRETAPQLVGVLGLTVIMAAGVIAATGVIAAVG